MFNDIFKEIARTQNEKSLLRPISIICCDGICKVKGHFLAVREFLEGKEVIGEREEGDQVIATYYG